MSAGYLLGEAPPSIEVNEADQKALLATLLQDDQPSHPSPLRPSLRLPSSSSSLREDFSSYESSSAQASTPLLSLGVPSIDYASSSTSIRTPNYDSGGEGFELEDDDGECEESMSCLIPQPNLGVHFHACSKQLIMVSASAAVHRVVSIYYRRNRVYKVNSQKPVYAHQSSFSPDDVLVSARADDHVTVVRRGAKSGKLTLTVHKYKSEETFHLVTRHSNHLTTDFTVRGHRSTPVLMALGERIYLIGDQNLAHVWSLDVSQSSLQSRELAWKQEHFRGFPRPNTKPTHSAGCPRVGFTWRNNLVAIGVEPTSMEKRSTSTSHKSSKRKSLKKPQTPSPNQPFSEGHLQSLNIWQFSIPNRTWVRRSATTDAPQGSGKPWPTLLHGCMAGENIACISVGREEGTCVWALDLSACAWKEIPGFLPKGARVYGMSSVGSVVYFMGHGLDPTTSSPVVHCNMADFEPWVESSQADKGIESMVFPPSHSLPGSESPSPACPDGQFLSPPFPVSSEVSVSPSLLPSYDSLPPPLDPRVAAFLFWTPYRRLHLASDDAQFEKIKNDLSSEWMTCAMVVMCFIGVDSAIMGLSKDGTIMQIDGFGERAVALSMMTSAIGLAVSTWMYCVYYPQDGDTFRNRALDALNTYAIFSIRARVPVICVGVTIVAFILFVVHTVANMFPEVVVPLLGLLGILIGLNWFIYLYYLIRHVLSSLRKAILSVFGRAPASNPAETSRDSKESCETSASSS